MNGHEGARKRKLKTKNSRAKEDRRERRQQNLQTVDQLRAAVAAFDAKSADPKHFADLPLSTPTATGLEASHFKVLTEVQARAIPLALQSHDILGAARTGSGKTLAFLIPVLECLYREQWTEYDGLGALILSPTRELAVQIFEVLRKIGRHHPFSAGLVIGGKSLQEEAERLQRMNILVCTPGRMLQHLDQTPDIEVNNLKILVLDEADRIMDMGFQSDVDALLDHLPRQRQTLLFSATQSKKVSDLARLSLVEPEYVAVHEKADSATPVSLQQHYLITPLHEKLNTLYGFLKTNLKSKMIVFLSSGKQVRFVYESFRHLRPGIPLLHLHGRQKQLARMEITRRFTSAQYSCLLATDVVARGVDFPAVDWVVQADCPEDADTYIHRVGRTARFQSNGRAILFLDPNEEPGFLPRLEAKKVPIQKVNIREKKKRDIRNELQNVAFQFPDVKYLAQKAFISYTRSLHLQKDKEVFPFAKYDLDAFASSLGLPGTPQIKFQTNGVDIKKIKNAPRIQYTSSDEDSEDADAKDASSSSSKKKNDATVRTAYDKIFERTNQDVLSSHYTKLLSDKPDGDDDGGDFLQVKRVLNEDSLDQAAGGGAGGQTPKVVQLGGKDLIIDSKRREKLLQSKKKLLKYRPASERLVFDDDGNPHKIYELQDEETFRKEGNVTGQIREFVESEAKRLAEADVEDKQTAKQRLREKKEKRKIREAMERDGLLPEQQARKHSAQRGLDDDDVGSGSDSDGPDEGYMPRLENAGDMSGALDLLRSLPTASGAGEEAASFSASDDERDQRPAKKAKKWFQNDSDVESDAPPGPSKSKTKSKTKSKKTNVIEMDRELETLEDYEKLAAGLLE